MSILAAAFAEVWSARRRAGFVVRENGPLSQLIDASRIGEQTALDTTLPHRAGTPANAAVAGYIGDRLQRIGLRVWNTPFEAEVYEPLVARLSLEERGAEKAYDLSEPGDGEAGFLAYSPDADLVAGVIFANEGSRADYERLLKKKIVVRGKLALVRAQGICRSMKAEIAGSLGVAGLILYPEPRDQGFAKPAFPEGPNTPRWAIPRGTLLRFYLYPGDPETSRAKGIENQPPVPALGVSQAVAEDLLSRMRGDAVPDEWKGWLKVPYVLAAEGPRVRLVVKGQVVKKTLRNLFAILPGENGDARPVMVGNHYDAWERGAVDASSGTAVVLEAAEALTKLRSGGWRPERSILFAFWDGEERMFGSTRWVEQAFRDRSRGWRHTSTSTPRRGRTTSSGMSCPAFVDCSRASHDRPRSRHRKDAGRDGRHVSVLRLLERRGAVPRPDRDASRRARLRRHYPVYHTRAGTVEWIRRFRDPGSARAALLARILALYAGCLANDAVVPYRFTEVSEYTRDALRDLEQGCDPPANGIRSPAGCATPSTRTSASPGAGTGRPGASRASLRRRRGRRMCSRAGDGRGGRLSGGRSPVYGRGSVLIGPFEGGVRARAAGGAGRAVRARDFGAIRVEGAELARAFTQAQELLRAAEWTALGPGGPVSPHGDSNDGRAIAVLDSGV